MNNTDNIQNESFNYTYSAEQQQEIETIRKKYMPANEDKMEQLRKMDRNVSNKATMLSIIVGVIGTLIMGAGMSLAMTNIGVSMGMSTNVALVVGIIVGIIGMAILGVAYPIYNYTIKKEREKIAPEIIRLTDELLK